MRSLIYANLTTRRPAVSVGGSEATMPPLLAGQQWDVALRFTEATEGVFSEVRPPVRAVRASVGPRDERPLAGTFRLQVGLGASTTANTTGALPYNATAAQVAAALNALSAGSGDYAADYDEGSYLIRRVGGGVINLTARANVLRPISAVRVRGYEVDGHWITEVRLVQAPYAFADNAAQMLPSPPRIETVVNGYTSPDGTWFVNEVQDLIIPQEFRSNYRLVFNFAGGVANTGLPRKTQVLSIEDGAEEIQTALQEIVQDLAGAEGRVSVTNPSNNVARITFGGEALQGIDVPEMTVEAFPLPGDEGDWVWSLDLNRAEMWVALRGQESVTVPFEVEADVYIDRADLSQGWRTVKLWSVPVTITRPVLYEGLASAQSIDWLRPISPRSYVPFNPDQIITGQQHWVGAIGFGTAYGVAFGTSRTVYTPEYEEIWTIDHNLASEALHVTVRENTGPGFVVNPKWVSIDNANSVSIAFGSSLGLGRTLGVVLTAAGPRSLFLAHTHTTAQVIGLEEIITALAERVLALENLLPKAGADASAKNVPRVVELPTVGEVLPDLNALNFNLPTVASQVFAKSDGSGTPPPPPAGTPAAAQEEQRKAEEENKDPDKMPPNVLLRAVIPGIGALAKAGRAGQEGVPEIPPEPADPAVFPPKRGTRMPLFLQAVSAVPGATAGPGIVADTSSISDPDALRGVGDGAVWRYTGATDVLFAGENGRPGWRLPPQGHVAYRNGNLYRVRKEDAASNIFYPVEFERELWRVHLSSDQLPLGAAVKIDGELRYRLLGEFFDAVLQKQAPVGLAAQYTLYTEALELSEAGVLGAVTKTTRLAATKLVLSPVLKSFRWRLEIKREANRLTSSYTAFSKTEGATGFAAPFVLRMRLGGFDIDDTSAELPRGQIALLMPSTKLEVTS